MKVTISIDDQIKETSITIKTGEWTEQLEEIVQFIKKREVARIFGVDEDQTILLEPKDIDYVFAENRKTYAAVNQRKIEVKMKLYEIEEILSPYRFTRFSKSVIGNLTNIQRFELSFNGNLCVYFHSGNKEYITRNFVKKVKELLQIGGQSNDG